MFSIPPPPLLVRFPVTVHCSMVNMPSLQFMIPPPKVPSVPFKIRLSASVGQRPHRHLGRIETAGSGFRSSARPRPISLLDRHRHQLRRRPLSRPGPFPRCQSRHFQRPLQARSREARWRSRSTIRIPADSRSATKTSSKRIFRNRGRPADQQRESARRS